MSPVLAHWSAIWPALIIYVLLAGTHLTGLRRLLAAAGAPADRRAMLREGLIFQGGLLLALLAIVSPFGYEARVFIWVRGLQDLTLAVLAPGLIVLGAPWAALARCAGQTPAAPPDGARAPWWLRWPTLTVVAFNVIWLAWHLPVLFDRVRAGGVVAAAQDALFLAAGTLFWLQMIGSRPWSPAARPLRRIKLLIGTVAADTVLGMVLVFGSAVIYPGFTNSAHHVMTVLDDQQLAGAVLWMGILPPVITLAVALFVRWLNDEESEALSAGLDRLLTQRDSAWPSRPRFR